MPGTFRFAAGSEDVSKPQPPPVAPRVAVQSWQSAPVAPLDGSLNMYGNHVRSGSVDSLDSSSGSSVSSSSSGSHTRQHSGDSGEFIPTRTLSKNPSVPAYNPLQFVKVQSPLYRKAEQQIKLVKEVKISRETLKEGEEEWQSNLDNWKSRRRKVSEKVFQRVEEMRQIEAEEQERQHVQQQRKIKTFSEIVEKRSQKKHNYNLDVYMGQGDDSGLGATPEPEDQDSSLDNLNSTARSDISEDVTSESESVDSDAKCSEKPIEKEAPEVPKKPFAWLSRKNQCSETFNMSSSSEVLNHGLHNKDLFHVDNPSSAEPSDIEGHAGDIEALSSEDDVGYCGPIGNVDSGLESLSDSHRVSETVDSSSDFSQDSCTGLDKANHDTDPEVAATDETDIQHDQKKQEEVVLSDIPKDGGCEMSLRLVLKQNIDSSKGFGFSLKGGKDQGSDVLVDSVLAGGAADAGGLLLGDEILAINGEKTCSNSHSSLVFAVKQAVYIGQIDLVIRRPNKNGIMCGENKCREEKDKVHKKGTSFAEKLAMFSNGASSNVSHSPSPPPVIPRTSASASKITKAEEVKKESLVLRRKSAFESSPSGDQVKKRWSSCVSNENGVSAKWTNGERRHSTDLTKPVDKVSQSNTVSKKPPPPPVPVKPKMKPRPQTTEIILSPTDLRSIVNTAAESVDTTYEQDAKNSNEDPESIQKLDSVVVPSSPEIINKNSCMLSENVCTIRDQSSSSDILVNAPKIENNVAIPDETADDSNTDICSAFNTELVSLSEDKSQKAVFSSPESPDTAHTKRHERLRGLSRMKSLNVPDDETPAGCEVENFNENSSFPYEETHVPSVAEPIAFDEVPYFDDVNLCFGLHELPDIPNNEPPEVDYCNDYASYPQPMCLESINEESPNFASEVQDDNMFEDGVNESEQNIGHSEEPSTIPKQDFKLDQPTVIDHDMSSEGRGCHVEINVQPLCLALEKIDEDDVVSASTTTSSETPDTETVIEHFPSNLSPLPNDDLVTENVNVEPQEPTVEEMSQTVTIVEDALESTTEVIENVTETINEIVVENAVQSITEASTEIELTGVCGKENSVEQKLTERTFLEVESSSHFRETFSRSQDDDVPLTEDVIDEIEMRLMQQLQQEGEFEDMCGDQDEPLEDEVNRQLLYLSDDADLLEDLDAPPRHVVPPSEPPPPPPPPEVESEENMTPPLMRVNSTKRLKKEISRRRSDFLGLGSAEGADIDNIPPPPPGLEELYKSEMEIEREQRLWLEKRLSLAEPLPSETTCFDTAPTDSLNSDYSYYQNNMPEVRDAEVYDAVASDYARTENQTVKEVYSAEEESSYLSESSVGELDKVAPENPTNTAENTSSNESPQHKAKQHIQSLGAAPRAKIMDSDKWITQTEKVAASKRQSMDPVLQESRCTQNFWLAQEAEKRSSVQRMDPQPHPVVDRRYSMPPAYGSRQPPDVTVRTWGDREPSSFQQRPKSAVWDASSRTTRYDPYLESCYSGYPAASRAPLSHTQYQPQAYSQRHPFEPRRCSYCREELTDGSAMGIEALQLYFHIECFHCCVCGVQLGNGTRGTDVQVKNNQLYCPNCFTLD